MARHTMLSPLQRAALFDPPTESGIVQRLYMLGPEEFAQVVRRRRAANRIGFAVQLSYQATAGGRSKPARRRRRRCSSCWAGNSDATRRRSPITPGDDASGAPKRDRSLARPARVQSCGSKHDDGGRDRGRGRHRPRRGDRLSHGVPSQGVGDRAPSTLERVALIARAQARRQAFIALGRDLGAEQALRLDQLLETRGPGGRTNLSWIREWPEAPSAGNLKALIERLDHVRTLQAEADRASRVHASRYAVISREAVIMSAQHLARLERRRRLATLVAFSVEMEVTLTDAAVGMVEKMVGSMCRHAERTRSERLIDDAKLLKETMRGYVRLGRALIEARSSGQDVLALIDETVGWDLLERSVREAEELTRGGDDGMKEVLERYPAVRRFAPTFLAAFTFRAARPSDPLLSAVELLKDFYADGRTAFSKRAPARS